MISLLVLVIIFLITIHFSSHSDNLDGTTTPTGLFCLWDWMKEKVLTMKRKDEKDESDKD